MNSYEMSQLGFSISSMTRQTGVFEAAVLFMNFNMLLAIEQNNRYYISNTQQKSFFKIFKIYSSMNFNTAEYEV